MRPYYLPREISHVLVVAVYIPPCDVLHSAVSRLQTQHTQALLLTSGDFNHASPFSTLTKFTQYTCHLRDYKTLDLFNANTKEAYSSSPLPPLRRSDHSLVHLLPMYKPLVHRQPAVRRWSEETEEALRDCFKMTVWEKLYDLNTLHHRLHKLLCGKPCTHQDCTVLLQQQTLD